ncbi:MAG: hypothetical protein HOD72_03180 [Opitutae bacterium]|nr:hypothetical protein [Opitutae bacterium]
MNQSLQQRTRMGSCSFQVLVDDLSILCPAFPVDFSHKGINGSARSGG